MSIPLDRLYDYLDSLSNSDTVIYRFYPHGSKKLEDLVVINDSKRKLPFVERMTQPSIIMHDQEPLNYQLYAESEVSKNLIDWHNNLEKNDNVTMITHLMRYHPSYYKIWTEFLPTLNLRMSIEVPISVYDCVLLAHSEKNSFNLKTYEDNGFIGVYWWSHAAIAKDWFRYAEYVKQQKQVKKTFLIYNRAWSGTREYRLRFAECLVKLNLQDSCQTSINSIEPELDIHYKIHKFKNPKWRPSTVLENFFPANTAPSHYSADFDIKDYEATDIEVVLETLFDDNRLHLTEKSLRPIACAQPFILAGTPGSLEYLRSYGFKTFGNVWDETYDTIKDPELRIYAITDLMKQIDNWAPRVREIKIAEAQDIADYNKKLFFSKQFQQSIFDEFLTNFFTAREKLEKHCTGKIWKSFRKKIYHEYPELICILKEDKDKNVDEYRKKDEILNLFKWLREKNSTPSINN